VQDKEHLWNVSSLNIVVALILLLGAIIGGFVIEEAFIPCVTLSIAAVLFLSFSVLLKGVSKIVEK
jgi:hypothetical protein